METVLQIKLLKNRIAQNDISIKNLLKVSSAISECDSDVQTLNKLNAELSTRMNNVRQDLADFGHLVKVIEDDDLRYHMENDLESILNQYEINMVVARKAIINTQKRLNNETRAKLFEYSKNLRNRIDNKNVVKNETLLNKSTAITDDLYTASRLLSTEVEKSGKNLETLVSSSALATETSQELRTMSNYISNSKTLLSKYGRREMTDKILTILALCFFFGCIIYVLFKRLYLRS
ncbi:vesicle transport protein SEC20-like protein [Euroglyphus maynei]|uniref:Vesicle transport protein SEC20-like protein n=1 Tax=Euroglyphus maynei TaxID=6958 RepID=A0A1Y3B2V5_EURMA|nr:vesicle transport protein SEC20-like protein [Euroglyphus maynei]